MDTSERRRRASSEAAEWFARLQAGEMERSGRQQFVEWLRESHIHVTEMLRIAQINGELEHFQHWARISTGPRTAEDNLVRLPMPRDEGSLPHARRKRGWGRNIGLFASATAVVLIVTGAMMFSKTRGQVIETERGERREVVLSDGTVLQVDPETRLRVKYADDVRRVLLERGRALFRVARSASRPFVVQADDTTVRAVGTAFGVEQQPHRVVVTVVEGKVAVFPSDIGTGKPRPIASTPPSPSDAEGRNGMSAQRQKSGGPAARLPEGAHDSQRTLFLTADQQVTVASSGAVEPVQEVDSHRALAWAEGRLIFQNESLGAAVVEFNRYNRVQLAVADPALAAKPVSGVFNATDPEAFVAFLKSATAVEVVRDGDRSITIGPTRKR
jgi:transmembrane sensor